jgi:tellurite resistance protein TehA-like permease
MKATANFVPRPPVAFVMIVMYLYSLFESGPPPPSVRPGMFIPVGSGSYTIIALLGQAKAVPRDYGYFAEHPGSADTLQAMALFVGIFLWIFMFWLFLIALLSNVAGIPNVGFTTTWWALIFPNVGFTVATVQIGQELKSPAILWIGSMMTISLVAVWLFTWVMCIRAIFTNRVMWPGKDEDKDM